MRAEENYRSVHRECTDGLGILALISQERSCVRWSLKAIWGGFNNDEIGLGLIAVNSSEVESFCRWQARLRVGAGRKHAGAFVFTILLLGAGVEAHEPAAATEARVVSDFHPRRILVQPRAGVDLNLLAEFHSSGRSLVLRSYARLGHLQVVQLSETESVVAALARFRQSELVHFAEPDYRAAAAATFPNDPRFQDGTLWGLHNYGQGAGLPDADVDAPEGWDVLRSASNVIVALIDSGVRYTHEDLASNLWTHPQDGGHGFNAITGNTNVWDDNGHGTHLAGIVGAAGGNAKGVVGVAWQLPVMACKFLDNFGDGFNSDAVACIEFARSNGAKVINLSWGGTTFSAAVSNAIRSAQSDGIIFAAAAGNNARSIDATPYYPASLDLDNIVAVGASTRLDQLWVSSNYGASNVDLFAPGALINSTTFSADNSYGDLSGTSMATAYVAGVLALLRSQSPEAPYQEIMQRLFAAVDHRPAFAGRCVTNGRLNLRKALDRVSVAAVTNQSPALPFQVRLSGVPNHVYVLQASTNLTDWASIHTNTANSEGNWSFTDVDSPGLPHRFYRGVVEP